VRGDTTVLQEIPSMSDVTTIEANRVLKHGSTVLDAGRLEPYTFRPQSRARAQGDLEALRNRGLAAVQITVGDIDAIKESL